MDSRDLYPNLIADEDYAFLCAIVKQVSESMAFFRINLPNNAFLTNDASAMPFVGVDQIKSLHQTLLDNGSSGEHQLIMPTNVMTEQTRIGEIFGMPIFADPTCPKDKFVIQPIEKST